MAIQSYSESYLRYVAENLGTMFEYAVDNGQNPIVFWQMFIDSNVAKQIEKGNPKYLTCSSLDYYKEIIGSKEINDLQDINKDRYYWAGWSIAQLQHLKGCSFYKINDVMNIQLVLDLYDTLHEANITKFYDVAETYFKNKKITNLKKIRKAMGLSQKELSAQSNVDLRSIQMYEQRRNDINKAQAETLFRLSKVLGCDIEDLLED